MKKEIQPGHRLHRRYNRIRENIERRLHSVIVNRKPPTVYDPIRYILGSGGKRFRAVLTLLSCDAVGGSASRAMNAAVAIEILHNFTLVHDDVMDHADLRRGRPTVHKQWDENIAILSGDEMIAQAYRVLLKTKSPRITTILDVYTDALVQVCEGQGFDKEFETRSAVTLDEYFMMISKKTGRVIAASTEIGALIGGGSTKQVTALRKYGEHLGRAFQVMDDLLDIIGTTEEFGKSIGGDIREGKKTFLLLEAIVRANGKERKLLMSIAPGAGTSTSTIGKIKEIYRRTGAVGAAKREVLRSTGYAQRMLDPLPSGNAKSTLLWLSNQLVERTS